MALRDQRLREQQPGESRASPIMDITAMQEWVRNTGGRTEKGSAKARDTTEASSRAARWT